MHLRPIKALFTVTVLILVAAATADATIHTVIVGNNFFSPLGTTVDPGDTVRWIWNGGVPHSTTSDASSPKQWDSGVSSEVEFTFELQFTQADGPGPFPYHCSVHPFTMIDTIFMNEPTTCCSGRVGDPNGMGGDEPTIGDVSVLIDALFITGNESPVSCLGEGDINQSGGANPVYADITIGDISILIDYLFITGPTLGLPDCL
jgi:plastocyanin